MLGTRQQYKSITSGYTSRPRTKNRRDNEWYITPGSRHRFRNKRVHIPTQKIFGLKMETPTYHIKNRSTTASGSDFITDTQRAILEVFRKAYVYQDDSENFKDSTAYLESLPCKALHIEDSVELTTLPLWLDLENSKSLNLYLSETVEIPEVFSELRAYDYLVLAFQRLVKELWLATYDDAKQCSNTHLNVFNFFGWHNLFNRRAAMLLEYFHSDPDGLFRKLCYKNAVIAERRTGYLARFIDNIEHGQDLPLKIKHYLFMSQASLEIHQKIREHTFTMDLGVNLIPKFIHHSGFLNYHNNLMKFLNSSIIYDYRTPILYACAKLEEAAYSTLMGNEDVMADIVSDGGVINTKRRKHPVDKINSSLCLGIPEYSIGHKLDFTKANRKGSLLSSDDLVEPYEYLPNLKTEAVSFSDSHLFDAWQILPYRLHIPQAGTESCHMSSSRSQLMGEELDVTLRVDRVTTDENIKFPAFPSLFPGDSMIYPPEMVFSESNVAWYRDPSNSADICEVNGTNANTESQLVLALSYNEKLGGRLSAVQNNHKYYHDGFGDIVDPITTALSSNALVLQGMSTLLIEYLSWVNNNFDVKTLSTRERHLLKVAQKLAKLCAKHGEPMYISNILSTILANLSSFPDSDF